MDTAEVSLIQMDEDAVVSFLESLGFPYYEDQIKGALPPPRCDQVS